jgi:hypothetical protein
LFVACHPEHSEESQEYIWMRDAQHDKLLMDFRQAVFEFTQLGASDQHG